MRPPVRLTPSLRFEGSDRIGALYIATGSSGSGTHTVPSTFKILDGPQYWGVHAKGEVWAAMLYEVYRNLNLRLPFIEDWHTNDKTTYANTLVLLLVIDGLKLQPCTPPFI
ncbi:Fungalysin/Thermolysin Extracellular metalloproteinase 5 [Podila minutissima]|uniref:Extracellular metalloproteinase n=1 Tax=Podila minutissima TaxID=64525 RepID=A0A9P5SBQ1_9FUNG|nr:Fungalysin/Thermolysin Extracellular metalloproteinase 5 [Podila minutissima]